MNSNATTSPAPIDPDVARAERVLADPHSTEAERRHAAMIAHRGPAPEPMPNSPDGKRIRAEQAKADKERRVRERAKPEHIAAADAERARVAGASAGLTGPFISTLNTEKHP